MGTRQPSPPTSLRYLEEDKVTEDECKDLIRSLPSAEGGLLYQYQGSWIPPFFIQGVISCQNHFQAHDTDILLVTSPKVGTTWLKAILFSLLNRGRYPNTQQHPLLTNSPHELVPFLEMQLYNKNQVPDLTLFTSPRLFSSHLMYPLLPISVKDSKCKIVYLCRNPKDTFVSIWHFRNKIRANLGKDTSTIEQDFDNFSKGISSFGSYWDHVTGYWKESLENSEKILFLKYEEMKEQLTICLKRVAEFLECPFFPEEEVKGVINDISRLCSFENLSNLDVNKSGKVMMADKSTYFRLGKVGDWTNYLTVEMSETLDRITKEKFHSIGLKI